MKNAIIITLSLLLFAHVTMVIGLYQLKEHDLILVFPEEIHPFDFATLLLTSSAVILTGTAVFVAIIALLGYRNIKQAAVRAALRDVSDRLMPAAVRAAEIAAMEQMRAMTVEGGDGNAEGIAAAFSMEDGQ